MTAPWLRLFLSGLAAVALAPAAYAGPMFAGAPGPGSGPDAYSAPLPDPGLLRIQLNGQGPAARTLALGRGKSAMIELPIDARDITVANPAVADVVLRTPRRISVLGLANGVTDAVFFDGMGHPILRLDIHVDQDGSAVAETIAHALPGSRVRVTAANNSLILTGEVSSPGDAGKAQQIAAQYVDKPEHVLNMLSISGQDQVTLKVRVVEVQRTAIKQLGFNMQAVVGQLGNSQWTAALAPTWGANGALIGGLTSGFQKDTTLGGVTPGSNGLNQAKANIQAFERAGLVRVLSEPNVTAVSGESANLLVGGEFPVPTGQDNNGRVTIDFKQYGVVLGFRPVVLSGGRISLKLSTEVSDTSNVGAFSMSSGVGAPVLVIPSLVVRRAQSTVELPSGGSMMIGGLLQHKTQQDIDSLPGLGQVPILGTLFRSRDYLNNETELVIIVTAYLVKPTSSQQLQTPADGLEIASDAQSVLLGRLNKAYQAPPDAVAGRSYQGPYGYVIE